MAFFGLTSLGPQNSFQNSLQATTYINVFTADEFENAFVLAESNNDSIPEVLDACLRNVYHGPPMESDEKLIKSRLNEQYGDTFSVFDFMVVIRELQAEADENEEAEKNKVSSGGEFKLASEYHHNLNKHTRMSQDPRHKYRTPVTASHDIGWEARHTVTEPAVAPRKNCEETIYADEVVRSGVFGLWETA